MPLRVQYVNGGQLLTPLSRVRWAQRRSQHQHKHYNNLLNNLMNTSHQSDHPSPPLEYSHLHLIDTFYPVEGQRQKVRVTRDEQSGKVQECMKKIRLGDLNIYSPKRAADWRVSVNLEVPGTLNYTRHSHCFSCHALSPSPPPSGVCILN